MTLAIKEELVLLGAHHDHDYLVNKFVPRHRNGSDILKKKNAGEGDIPLNLSGWIGHYPDASESVMFSRTYRSLEDKGLPERINLGGYSRTTSHLKLTEAGDQAAKELAAEAVS